MNRLFINNGIKCVAAATLVSGLGLSTAVQATEAYVPEAFRVNLDWSFPRSSDNWDGGLGIRVQALFPAHFVPRVSEKYSVGLSLGVSSWDANDEQVNYTSPTNGVDISGRLSGDARSVNLGASFIRADFLPNGLELTSELGLIFSSISSDVRIDYDDRPSEDLDVDNTFSALLAIDANYKASEDLTIFGGIGYHFDLGAGDASIASSSAVEKNYTNAVFIRGGLKF